jgi:hypothetical protein
MAILRKIKEGLKKIVRKGKNAVKTQKKLSSSGKKAKPVDNPAREALGTQETMVGQAKFSHPEPGRRSWSMPQELPWGYDKDKAVLQVRDPWWLHTYWEITTATMDNVKSRVGEAFSAPRWRSGYMMSARLFLTDTTRIDFLM